MLMKSHASPSNPSNKGKEIGYKRVNRNFIHMAIV